MERPRQHTGGKRTLSESGHQDQRRRRGHRHPLPYLFKALGVPLRLLTYSTSGMVHIFFRILLTPVFGVVLLTSSIWATTPQARPLLLIFGPPFVILSLWLLPLFPEQAEIREAKISLCKVWPLSRRRLEWIKTHRVY